MNWMRSAQAKHLAEDHERDEARKSKGSTPETEAEALLAYKTAHVIDNPRKRRQLEAQAEAHGWTTLREYKSRSDERRRIALEKDNAARQQAAERAANITTRQEAIELHKAAINNDDETLALAIAKASKNKGWNLMRKNLPEYTAELHEQFTDLITGHDATSRIWRDDLRNKRVTPEYANEQTEGTTAARKAQLDQLLNDVATYATDAQAEYDRAFATLATLTGDTNEQLLAEIRAGKIWDRTQRELSGLPDGQVTAEITNRVSSADPATLKVLMDELPSFLAGKGLDNAADIVRSAVNQSRPELQDAQARVTEAAKLQVVANHNARQVAERLSHITPADATPRDLIGYVNPTTVAY